MAKNLLSGIALFILSTLATCIVFEIAARLFIHRLPQTTFNLFARELRILGQTSKESLLPNEPFIAVIGDSYGSGSGDWFVNNGHDLNSRYQATHILQQELKQDVVSLSRSGAGSYDGLAIFAPNAVKVMERFGFSLGEPETILIYFYEGNDISDNLRFMEKYYLPEFEIERLYDDQYFAKFADSMEQRFVNGFVRSLDGNTLVIKAIGTGAESFLRLFKRPKTPRAANGELMGIINGRQVPLSEDLRLRDMINLTPEQYQQGVRFFERALDRARKFWPNSRLIVFYIPAPITSYYLLDQTFQPRRDLNLKLVEMVRQASIKNGAEFADSTPTMLQACESEYLHGPIDWFHFNKRGYQVLASVILDSLRSH